MAQNGTVRREILSYQAGRLALGRHAQRHDRPLAERVYAKDGRPAYCYNLFGLQRFKVDGNVARQ